MTPLFELLFERLDERVRLRKPGRKVLNKAFPHHWSFLLGEVALFSFVILVLTGIFLTMFYRPLTEPVLYTGSAALYQGRELPAAFASIVELTHDVPGGLLFRRVHRGAAYLFVAAAVAHLVRILLTGAFRRPREPNYHLGLLLLLLALGAAYTGQNLPYDLLSQQSLWIGWTYLVSVPLVGPNLATLVFGGDFPGPDLVPRFFVLHILVLPGLITALVTLHLLVVGRQRHTQFPEPGVDGERNVLGRPLWPSHFATSTSLVLVVGALLAAFAVLVPWSDVDLHGPYRPGMATNASHPDFWLFWLEAALTLHPAWEWRVPGLGAITMPFLAGVVLPLVVFGVLFAYPYVDRRVVGERAAVDHHVLDRPLDVPLRAGLVLGLVSLVATLTLASGLDVYARWLDVPVERLVWFFRVAVVLVPPAVAVAVAWRGRVLRRRQEAPR